MKTPRRPAKTPTATWSDGLHFVRPAAASDDHPLKWIAANHRKTPVKFSRRAESEEAAIALARDASKRVMAKNDGVVMSTMRPAAQKVQSKALPKFPSTYFNCIRANPVAQVWQCVYAPGERKGPGRHSKKENRPARQAPLLHQKGECAVLCWREPVRNSDGSIRVFRSWQEAEHYALDLYDNADEEDRIRWDAPEGVVVARTANVDIRFDPSTNSDSRPFSLWLPKLNKPVYGGYVAADYGVAGAKPGGGTFQPTDKDGLAALEAAKRIKRLGARQRLSTEPATFESIWAAEEHALTKTERTLRGETPL